MNPVDRHMEALQKTEIKGTAGGGMVVMTTNGLGQFCGCKIDPDMCVKLSTDPEFLEDLIVAAVNDAQIKMGNSFLENFPPQR